MRRLVKNTTKYITMLIIATMVLMFSGCGKTEDDADDSNEKAGSIEVITKGTDYEFWDVLSQGLMDGAEEFNYKLTFESPNDGKDVDAQIQLVKDAIKNDVDAIVIAPLDAMRLNKVIEKAVNKGIPVITVDSDVTTSKKTAFIGTNNENFGAVAARYLADDIGGIGEVAMVSRIKGDQITEVRTNGFKKEIEDHYQHISIVDLVYSGGDEKVAYDETNRLIADYPDLKAIYATDERDAIGVAKAISEHNLKDKIWVVGFDYSEASSEYLLDGTIDGTMIQNPYNMGYLAVRNIVKVKRGETVKKFIDTGATYVTKDNYNDEGTQWLLDPLGKE
jgi:ribose transport system substrate-binding protein